MPSPPPVTPPPAEGAATASPRNLVRALGPAGLLGVLWATLPAIGGILLLAYLGKLSEILVGDGDPGRKMLGLVGYVCVFIVSAGLGFLPTYAQSILGGWAFGFVWGSVAALTGFAGASLIGYAIARTVARERVERVIRERPKWRAVRDALVGERFGRTLLIVFLVRLPPNSPFALTNLVLASAGVRPLAFLVGTVTGMAPRTCIAVYLGAKAAAAGAPIDETTGPTGTIYYVQLAATIVIAFIALGVIGRIAQRTLDRMSKSGRPPAPPGDEGA